MRNLIPLHTNPIDEFDLIHQKKHDPAHIILQGIRPLLVTRYNTYQNEFKKNTLQNIKPKPISFFPDAAKHLRECYLKPTKALNNLIVKIKEKQPNHLRSVCQYCGIDTDNTTDHYLPQSDFPEYSVNHLNLFPCCAVCNPIKNNYWFDGTNYHRGIINLYTDILPDVQFLFADVKIIKANPIIKFNINNSNRINSNLYQVIENHFTRIKLLEKYNDKVGNIYQRIYNSYANKPCFKNNPGLIQQDLLIEAENHLKSFGRNHYEGILKEALANNKSFLNLF